MDAEGQVPPICNEITPPPQCRFAKRYVRHTSLTLPNQSTAYKAPIIRARLSHDGTSHQRYCENISNPLSLQRHLSLNNTPSNAERPTIDARQRKRKTGVLKRNLTFCSTEHQGPLNTHNLTSRPCTKEKNSRTTNRKISLDSVMTQHSGTTKCILKQSKSRHNEDTVEDETRLNNTATESKHNIYPKHSLNGVTKSDYVNEQHFAKIPSVVIWHESSQTEVVSQQ